MSGQNNHIIFTAKNVIDHGQQSVYGGKILYYKQRHL